MKNKHIARGEKAGWLLGFAICEMVNLMYQNNTAFYFLRGLRKIINSDFNKRLNER